MGKPPVTRGGGVGAGGGITCGSGALGGVCPALCVGVPVFWARFRLFWAFVTRIPRGSSASAFTAVSAIADSATKALFNAGVGLGVGVIDGAFGKPTCSGRIP